VSLPFPDSPLYVPSKIVTVWFQAARAGFVALLLGVTYLSLPGALVRRREMPIMGRNFLLRSGLPVLLPASMMFPPL
jgi:hypothetical protein